MGIKTRELQQLATVQGTDCILVDSSSAGTGRLALDDAAKFLGRELVKPGSDTEKAFASKQNTLTGQPGQVVGFDASGAAAAVRGWSNPNLLHNWYLADSINQRGQMEYSGYGYTIDRWRIGTENPPEGASTTLTVGANGEVSRLTLAAGYGQFLQTVEGHEDFRGKQVTASLLYDSYEVETFGNDGTDQPSQPLTINGYFATTTFIVSENSTTLYCGLQNNDQTNPASLRPIAMKLELGGQQTLAHQDADGNWVLNDPPPDKALELAKCQRYYQAVPHWAAAYVMGQMEQNDVEEAVCTDVIWVSPPMRTAPTLIKPEVFPGCTSGTFVESLPTNSYQHRLRLFGVGGYSTGQWIEVTDVGAGLSADL